MCLLKSLVVYVLFMMFLQVVINFLLEQSNVCFLDILIFKNGTNVTLHPQKDTMSADVTFFEKTMFFSTKDDFDSIQQALPIPYLSLGTYSNLPLLKLNCLHFNVHMSKQDTRGGYSNSLDSCPVSLADPALDPPSSSPSHDSDISWPIALQKGIRSTCNPHPIYLSYHSFIPFVFSFVSSVSSTTILKSVCEALDHLG
ncbi:hypothetical protein CR513_59102, partial [Mucuna pruriens]